MGDRALELGRVDAPQRAVDRTEPRAAGEIFRRAAFVLDRVRLAVIEADAARLAGQRQRQRIRGRAGADEEHRDLALENLVEFVRRRPCRDRRCHRPSQSRHHAWRAPPSLSGARPPNCPKQKSYRAQSLFRPKSEADNVCFHRAASRASQGFGRRALCQIVRNKISNDMALRRNFRSRRAKIICVSVLKAVKNSAISNLGQYCCLI